MPVVLQGLRGQLAQWSFVLYKAATIWGSTAGRPQVVLGLRVGVNPSQGEGYG